MQGEVNYMTNVLEDRFWELIDQGFIYNEPNEKGQDMSYGEYAAVADELKETLDDYLRDIPFENVHDALRKALDCTDDVRIFVNLDKYDDFLENLQEEEINGDYFWVYHGDPDEIPEVLKEKYEEYQESIPEPYEEEDLEY